MSRTRYCIIEGCDNEVGKRAKRDICRCCQNGLRYWDDRDFADVEAYQRKLVIRQARMGTILGKSKSKRKRPAVAAPARTEARASH